MLPKFLLLIDGKIIDCPTWKNDDNHPFQSSEDARDWGDEITPDDGAFEVVSVDGSYREVRTWEKTGLTFTGRRIVIST